MDFRNLLKGTITQTLIKSLLEDAGYRVIPLGVEEVVREIKALSSPEYRRLGLPAVLRCLPDFLIVDSSFKGSWLLEVKYRREWNEQARDGLKKAISKQVSVWQPLFLVVFLGASINPNNETPANSIGVMKVVKEDGQLFCSWEKAKGFGKQPEECRTPWNELEWNHFSRIQDVFHGLSDRWEDSTLIKSLGVLRSLKELDLFN